VRARVVTDEGDAVLHIEAPEGAAIPSGWTIRVTTASLLVERDGGQLVARDESPSCNLRLPAVARKSPFDP